MTGNWTAPPPTAEAARQDELTAAGLKRDSFTGRLVPTGAILGALWRLRSYAMA